MIIKHIKETKEDKIFNYVVYITLSIVLIVVAYPLIYVLSSSFSSADAVMYGQVVLWPVDFSLEGYITVFQYQDVWTGYQNTLFYTTVGTILNVVLTVMMAYPLSRKDLVGGNVVMFFVTVTMFLSGGMIPSYLLMYDLGLLNTRLAMILPVAISAWNLILTRTFFQNSIPNEIYESASIDGCGNMKFIISMVLPLSKPIIAVITLYYAVAHWNSYFNAMMYLRSSSLYPLQLILRNILIENEMLSTLTDGDVEAALERERLAELLKYSLIVISSVPLLVAYQFVQKFFVKGVMVGAIKG